jgi:hypothetical protein
MFDSIVTGLGIFILVTITAVVIAATIYNIYTEDKD